MSLPAERLAVPAFVPTAYHVRPNILIVDDRRENLLATEKVLRHLDATMFKAMSGNEALSLMLRHKFAVVLLDVQMPEMDGFETALLMQDHHAMRGTPIIFITAISKEEKYATQAAELGAVDYIFKPINPEILRSKIKVYLDLFQQREQILRLNEVLTQSNEELERFAYICSHDMQEPARIMKSYAELLSHKFAAQLDRDARQYLDIISNHSRHMENMIRDILTFARIGREEIATEDVDCNHVLEGVLSEFEPVIREKRARIMHAQLPHLHTSPTLMHVMLQNLVGNALKFQKAGTTPEIRIDAILKDALWEFSVRDNGIGIEPQYSEKIFAIFQRIHRRDDYPGTGIGLSTCKKFIELCGGKIWFESTAGNGTSFFFTLPTTAQKGLP